MSKNQPIAQQSSAAQDVDDEPDEWYEPELGVNVDWSQKLTRPLFYTCRDKRIFSTGCAEENANLTDCHWKKKDWRACKAEMEVFRACWKKHDNDARTSTKDN
ncbi:hypothetical protein F5X97DRAFT_340988 [Nemania serpens]|nr:hypothetical protein F5X97DRAFT_340988 [Nemania serpens]